MTKAKVAIIWVENENGEMAAESATTIRKNTPENESADTDKALRKRREFVNLSNMPGARVHGARVLLTYHSLATPAVPPATA